MKKISFLVDEKVDNLLSSVAWAEDISKSSLIRKIILKEIWVMAHQKGMLRKHEIEKYIKGGDDSE